MHKIDVTKGEVNGVVSAQWALRPDDEKFLDLTSLRKQVATWAEESHTSDVLPAGLKIEAVKGDATGLRLISPEGGMDLSHFAFGQVAALAKSPAYYLRTLPAPLAALNLNYGLQAADQRETSLYVREPGDAVQQLLRGLTSTKYGRILDRDVVDAVMAVAGNGTGDTRWKVPGTIDWGSSHGISYNPNVEISKETTTLYASDRDIFLFLVDDLNPIEVGKLDDGSPDLMFRGFYVWNSEVGNRSFGIATMYLRGVCQNRNLWGVEGFSEVTFKHTAGAPNRFVDHAAPTLQAYAETSPVKLISGVKAAKAAIVSKDDDERIEFLRKFGFSEKQAKALIATSIAEEGHPQVSLWDHAQAITAQARKVGQQDKRLTLEQLAGKILDKVPA